MSGYFRGPPLMAHVFGVAVAAAVGVPLLAGWLDSFPKAMGIGLGLAAIYAAVAVVWASGGKGPPK